MKEVGDKFGAGELILPFVLQSAEVMKKTVAHLENYLEKKEGVSKGLVVLATVYGDVHDIGKNIVTFMLEINGYKVVDLGIDVPVENFIESIKEHKPQVVGLSGFLTLAFDAMKQTVEAMKEAGLRNNVKIMIGGGQVDEAVKNYTGADAFGLNAMDAVSLCKQWVPA